MTPTWDDDKRPMDTRIGPWGWARVLLRGVPIVGMILLGLVALCALYGVERLMGRRDRAASGWVTVFVCRIALGIMGLPVTQRGTPLRGPGAFVANHASWVDIFVLNAGAPLTFLAKAEVAGWPGIGWLAKATGTLFISRARSRAATENAALTRHLNTGQRPLFFPEGTSTDGLRVLPFKAPLFQAFLSDDLPGGFRVQPVTVHYRAPRGADPRAYGWWGDMDFGPHLLSTLALAPQGRVTVSYHPPLDPSATPDRKALAALAENAVRSAHQG